MGILNDRIKYMRNKRGMTLLQLADKIGVKEATMQRYESGEIKNIKHETVSELAAALKCTPAFLMGWEVEDAKQVNSLVKIAEMYKNRPGSQILFDFAANATPDDLEKAVEYIEFLKSKNK